MAVADLPLAALAAILVATVARAAATPVATIRTGIQPCAAVQGFGAVWVSVYGSARLSRIDPATNRVTTSIPVGASPCGLAIGAGSVWIDGYGTNTIERVNPRTRKVRPIRVGSAPFDVAYAFGAVWSTDNGSRQVSRIDPRTNRVVRVIRTGGAPAGHKAQLGYASLVFAAGGILSRLASSIRCHFQHPGVLRSRPQGSLIPRW